MHRQETAGGTVVQSKLPRRVAKNRMHALATEQFLLHRMCNTVAPRDTKAEENDGIYLEQYCKSENTPTATWSSKKVERARALPVTPEAGSNE